MVAGLVDDLRLVVMGYADFALGFGGGEELYAKRNKRDLDLT